MERPRPLFGPGAAGGTTGGGPPAVAGSLLLFPAWDPLHGTELWAWRPD